MSAEVVIPTLEESVKSIRGAEKTLHEVRVDAMNQVAISFASQGTLAADQAGLRAFLFAMHGIEATAEEALKHPTQKKYEQLLGAIGLKRAETPFVLSNDYAPSGLPNHLYMFSKQIRPPHSDDELSAAELGIVREKTTDRYIGSVAIPAAVFAFETGVVESAPATLLLVTRQVDSDEADSLTADHAPVFNGARVDYTKMASGREYEQALEQLNRASDILKYYLTSSSNKP